MIFSFTMDGVRPVCACVKLLREIPTFSGVTHIRIMYLVSSSSRIEDGAMLDGMTSHWDVALCICNGFEMMRNVLLGGWNMLETHNNSVFLCFVRSSMLSA